MKQYNFDELIPRKGTNCIKHDALNQFFGRDDLMPMWVADMDFRTPDFIMEALRNRCSQSRLGRSCTSSPALFQAFPSCCRHLHNQQMEF